MNIPIPALVEAIRAAKQNEDMAVETRRALEAQLFSHFTAPADGEGTVKQDDFSITYKVTRKVDTDALQAAWSDLSLNAQKSFRWKADIDLKTFRAIQDLDQPTFMKLSKFVTTTPAKPTLTLKA